MEVAFFDTSALVKHYHIERGSSIVNELMENYVVAISELAILEMTSALKSSCLLNENALVGLLFSVPFKITDLEYSKGFY